MVIGCGFDVDIMIVDVGLSCKYVEIFWDGECVMMCDFGLINGMKVNGQKFCEVVFFNDMIIMIGCIDLVFWIVFVVMLFCFVLCGDDVI